MQGRVGFQRAVMVLLYVMVFSAPEALSSGRAGPVFVHSTFEDFSAGELGNSGHNIFVSRDGRLRFINWFDLTRILQIKGRNHVGKSMFLVYNTAKNWRTWEAPDG